MARIDLSLGLLGALALAPHALATSPGDANLPTPGEPAQAPEREAEREVLAALRTGLHAVRSENGGLVASNPGQAWSTRFDSRGALSAPDAGGWSWGLELVRYGVGGEQRGVGSPRALRADGARVRYDWDGLLEEWYVNDARGLEHGFTLRRRPAGEDGEPLTLFLAVRGELRPEVAAGGRDVRFHAPDGALALTYSGLLVLDADGAPLEAGFERVEQGLRLRVQDQGARYPLTIDPVAQQAYLKASNTNTNDDFGRALALSGDTAVIGAPGEDSAATGVNGDGSSNTFLSSGAAYVFVRSGGVWSQQAYLKASNTGSNDDFGRSVAISGDTIVVGAPAEDSTATGVNGDGSSNGASSAGAAYVFVRNAGSWTQQGYLKASNTGSSDDFGRSVAISGDTIVVGAPGEDSAATGVDGDQTSNALSSAGAVYVFTRSAGSWSQQAYVKASNTGSSDAFGGAVAIDGDTLVVGATGEDSAATGVDGDQTSNALSSSGAAYAFTRSGTTWSQQAYLKASNTGSSDAFGVAVAVEGDTLVVGATGEDSAATGVDGDQTSNASSSSGAAYVFTRSGSAWSQSAYLKASNTDPNDQFGGAVALSRAVLLVGAPGEDGAAVGAYGDAGSNAAPDAGAVHLFVRSGAGWEEPLYLKASNTNAIDGFGLSVAAAFDTVLAGAPLEDSSASGVNGDQASNAASASGAAYALRVCSTATVVFRNAGTNPASYTAAPAVLGQTWTATVNNAVAGKTGSLLFAYESPTAFPLPAGQTLLCIDLGSGELFTGANLHPVSSAGGIDGYALAIPSLPHLDGAVIHTQALQFGGPPFVLSNAQDLTLGAF